MSTNFSYFVGRFFNVLAILGLGVLSGCQFIKSSSVESEQQLLNDQPLAESKQQNLPKAELSQALLTQLLAAEIAVREGQYEQAIKQVLPAARQTKDPRLAAKATFWALQGQLFDQAKTASMLWLKLLDPKEIENITIARLALAASYMQLGQVDEALPIYQQVIEVEDSTTIYKKISSDFSRFDDQAAALNVYQVLLEQADDQVNANVGLAILAARLHEFELSRKAVDQALVIDGAHQDAALIKFSYLVEDQNKDEIEAFAKRVLHRKKDNYRLRMEYARYLAASNHPERAIQQFEKVAKKNQSLAEEASLNIVALALESEDYELADDNLERLLDESPVNERLIFYRCQVQRELKNFAAANELCHEIVHGEYYFSAQLELAEVLADQGKIQQAVDYLSQVPVAGSAEQIQVFMHQQSIWYQAKQIPQAVKVLDQALAQYVDNTSLLYARGLMLSELGRVEEHERDMRRLIELEPENAHAYNALGYTLADLTTRYDEALALIEIAVQLDPEDAYILDSLGWVYFKLNDLEQAKLYLEQAFGLSDDAEIAAHLGELYWVLGQRKKAKSIWDEAISNTPDNKVLNATVERLL